MDTCIAIAATVSGQEDRLGIRQIAEVECIASGSPIEYPTYTDAFSKDEFVAARATTQVLKTIEDKLCGAANIAAIVLANLPNIALIGGQQSIRTCICIDRPRTQAGAPGQGIICGTEGQGSNETLGVVIVKWA